MSDKWSNRKTLIIIFGGTVVAFVVLVAVSYVLLTLFGGNTDETPDFWAVTQSVSAAVTAAAVVGGGYCAYRQLVEVASTRYMDVADRLFDELNSQENIESRRWIFQELPDDAEKGLRSLKDEGRTHVKRTLNSMDRVAFLTQAGWIPEDNIMPWMNPMIVKAWTKLKPYVERERELRREPDYYEHASDLGERCTVWRDEKLGQVDFEWRDDAL